MPFGKGHNNNRSDKMSTPARALEPKPSDKPAIGPNSSLTSTDPRNWTDLIKRFAPIAASLVITQIIATMQPQLSKGLFLFGLQIVLFVSMIKAWAPKDSSQT